MVRDDPGPELDARRIRETLDSLREGVQVLSPEWRYLYVNEAVARHGRRSREELLGRTMLECYPGIEKTAAFEVLASCMRERRAQTFENEFEYPDGERATFELRVQPVEDGLVVISLDVSERKRLETMLRQGEKLRALGQMAASVAHDLKNILNPIALEARALRQSMGKDPARVADVLARIEASVRLGSETVERLRHFSRQEPEEVTEAVDLNGVTDAALEICRPRIRERATVELRRQRRETPSVLAHAPELTATIVNLVVNALDAIPERGAITIRTEAAEGGAYVEVSDDGAGMPPEVERHLFEPFFTTKPQGTGLGLAMAYAFVKRHGGRISLETAPGRGTTVRMWFAGERPEEPAAPAEETSAPLRLLVVEDDAGARIALEALLRDEGFVVDVAGDGDEALARLASFEPQVLVVDLRMPRMDGVTLARQVRAERGILPVVVMSGTEDSDPGIASLLREPHTAHVTKPIVLERLVEAVDRVLGRVVGRVVGR